MIKVLTTLKRKPGMSVQDFRAYYENHHRLIGEKYLAGYAARYVRRYLDPVGDAQGTITEPEFDVLLEIWFEDQDAYSACGARLQEPEAAAEIIADEEKLFDRARKRSYVIEECESALTPPA